MQRHSPYSWGMRVLIAVLGVAILGLAPALAQQHTPYAAEIMQDIGAAIAGKKSPTGSRVVVRHQHLYEYGADGQPRRVFCFAAGTNPNYMNYIASLVGGETSLSASAPKQPMTPFQFGGAGLPITHFQFNDADRWSATVTDGGGLQQGDPTNLTWSLVPDGTLVDDLKTPNSQSPSNLIATMSDTANFPGSFSQALALLQQVFDEWEQLTGIDFTFVHNGNGQTDDGAAFPTSPGSNLGGSVRGDIRIGGTTLDGNGGILAFNDFPDIGDGVIDTADSSNFDNTNNFRSFRSTASHELGHGLGLAHVCPDDGTKLMEPLAEASLDGPEFDDIVGGQRGYGDNKENNDSAGNATNLGTIAPGQMQEVGALNIPQGPVGSEEPISLDDDGDTDFYRFTTNGPDQTVTVTMTTTTQGTYQQGAQVGPDACIGSTTSNFDPKAQLDVTVSVLGTDGTTVIQSANMNGTGGTETVMNAELPTAGTYFIRVQGTSGNKIQMYHLKAEVGLPPLCPDGTTLFMTGRVRFTEPGCSDEQVHVTTARETVV